MSSDTTTKMRRKLQIKPGLVLIRLKATGRAPLSAYHLVILEEGQGSITLVPNPLGRDGVLRAHGDCAVVSCSEAAAIEIEVEPASGQTVVSGSLQIEYLSESGSARAKPPRAPVPKKAASGGRAVGADTCFMAHIAYHGDRYFRLDEWIGSPDRSDALEGLVIRPDMTGVPKLMLRDPLTRQVAEPGQLLGTRGRNMPMRALDLWVADRNTSERLQIDALFRKAGHLRLMGQNVSLVGLDATDVLLGLRVSLVSAQRKRGGQGRASRVKIYTPA